MPVTVICKILGVPLKDERHVSQLDPTASWRASDLGPEAATEEGKARAEKGKASTAAFAQYMAGLIEGFIESPARACSRRW